MEIPDPEKLEAFALWAFGDGYQKVHCSKLPDMWNKKHGDKYRLYPQSVIANDVPKMVKLWREWQSG